MKDNIPTLKGFVCSDPRGNQIAVWCPYCHKFHYHGWPEGSDKDKHNHRTPHCIGDNPMKHTGYYIATFTKAELKMAYPSFTKGRSKVTLEKPEKK